MIAYTYMNIFYILHINHRIKKIKKDVIMQN